MRFFLGSEQWAGPGPLCASYVSATLGCRCYMLCANASALCAAASTALSEPADCISWCRLLGASLFSNSTMRACGSIAAHASKPPTRQTGFLMWVEEGIV